MMWERLERYELKRAAHHRDGGPPGPRPAPSLPIGTDLMPQIKHIVVLMMENHSYDNYFGMLHGRGEGFTLGPDGEPEAANPGTGGESIRAYHLTSTEQHSQAPLQSWHATHHQGQAGPAGVRDQHAEGAAGR